MTYGCSLSQLRVMKHVGWVQFSYVACVTWRSPGVFRVRICRLFFFDCTVSLFWLCDVTSFSLLQAWMQTALQENMFSKWLKTLLFFESRLGKFKDEKFTKSESLIRFPIKRPVSGGLEFILIPNTHLQKCLNSSHFWPRWYFTLRLIKNLIY